MAPGVISIVVLGGIVTAGFVALSRILSDNQTRRRLADRGLSAEEIRVLFQPLQPSGYDALRTSLLLLFVGGALMISQYLPFDSRDPFLYGMVAFAGGLGLLTYQVVLSMVRRHIDRSDPREAGAGRGSER